MIYDCLTFYNNLDLLDIRFHELANVVDYFVIVEARERFDGVKKPLYYWENRGRFAEFWDKIVWVGLREIEATGLEERGVWQCNQIMRGLTKAKDTDLIIISDNDEIPRAKSLRHLKFPLAPYRPFHQPMYMFYVNWFWTWRWNGSVILTYDYLVNHCKTPRQARLSRRHGIKIDNGGWHFSRLVGNRADATDRIQNYLRNQSHYEIDTDEISNKEFLDNRIKELKGYHPYNNFNVAMTMEDMSNLPKYVQENPDKFKEYLR